MNLITFDALRTLHLPGTRYIKPEQLFAHLHRIAEADWVLFAEHWQLPPLLYSLRKRIFPSPASYMIGHSKVETTRAFQALAPDNLPVTLIEGNTPERAERVWERMVPPFVAKIPRSSMGQGVFLIETRAQWQAYLALTPVIYAQEYLPIDRDLRIVWVGRRIIGGYWRLQSSQGFYNNVSQGGSIEHTLIPREAYDLVERLATATGIDYGGFDVAMLGSHPYLIEYNRLFGNAGLAGQQALIDAEILDYLGSRGLQDDPEPPLVHPEVV
jgi:ribosomal protein S6--L-glutamate ligase